MQPEQVTHTHVRAAPISGRMCGSSVTSTPSPCVALSARAARFRARRVRPAPVPAARTAQLRPRGGEHPGQSVTHSLTQQHLLRAVLRTLLLDGLLSVGAVGATARARAQRGDVQPGRSRRSLMITNTIGASSCSLFSCLVSGSRCVRPGPCDELQHHRLRTGRHSGKPSTHNTRTSSTQCPIWTFCSLLSRLPF